MGKSCQSPSNVGSRSMSAQVVVQSQPSIPHGRDVSNLTQAISRIRFSLTL